MPQACAVGGGFSSGHRWGILGGHPGFAHLAYGSVGFGLSWGFWKVFFSCFRLALLCLELFFSLLYSVSDKIIRTFLDTFHSIKWVHYSMF